MESQNALVEQICPREEIALYLDGELSSHEEIVFEKHLAVCPTCLNELNNQKEMLLALDFAFGNENEIELPKDFTRVVVAKAESGVKGLRSKKERSRALFLCIGLFLLILIGLGEESERSFGIVSEFARQFIAILGFTFRLIFDVTTAAVVVLRGLSQQVIASSIFWLAFIVGGIIFTVYTLSRFWFRFSRS